MPSLIDELKKLHENNAYSILLHPKVIKNYKLYEKEFAERPLVMQSHPTGIEIEMTNRCNLACVQCLRSLGLKPYKLGDMDPENYKKILAQFPYAMNISLNGFGEPTMYKHFFDIVSYTRKERPWARIQIYTNGMLINEEFAHKVMDCGLTAINISIDAADPDTYRRVRRGGKLDVLHENIRNLVRIKKETRAKFPLIGLNYVMVNENEGELVRFVEQTAEFGVDHLNSVSWAAYDWGFKNKRTKESYMRELEAAKKRMDELGVECKYMPELNTRWTDPEKPFDCAFYWGEEFRVAYNGDILLGCCTPFREQYSYGNLLETPFEEIWNGEKFRRNRQLTLNNIAPTKNCVSCDMYCKSYFSGIEAEGGNQVISPDSLLAGIKR